MDRKAAVFIAMGFELVALILTVFYIGKWLDEKYALKGLAVFTGLTLAFIGWLVHLLTMAQKLAKSTNSGDTPQE